MRASRLAEVVALIPALATATLAQERSTPGFDELAGQFAEADREYRAAAAENREPMPASPAAEFLPRFQALADERPGTDDAAWALSWIYVRLPQAVTDRTQRIERAQLVLDRLVADHPTHPAVSSALAEAASWGTGYYGRGVVDSVRIVLSKAEAGPARTAALYALGQLLAGGAATPDEPDEEELAEAKKVFAECARTAPETAAGKAAANLLFELENLQVGSVAPDFEATDAAGVAFRLSDYRGKVVVLDFWGFW